MNRRLPTHLLTLLLAVLSSKTLAFQTSRPTTRKSVHQSSSPLLFKSDHTRRPSSITRTSTTTQLDAAANPLVALASSPVGAIAVLATIVLVHESGHYLAARAFNISVEEFSIGFGPKVLGFEALGNAFNLRALPLGGYVKFPENYNITLVQEQQRAAQKAFDQRKQAEEWTPVQEVLNIVTLGEWDERRRQKRKREEEAQASSQQSKWWQFGRNSNKKSIESADPEDFDIEYYEDETLLQNRPWTERAVVLSAGVIFNLILSFSIYFGAIGTPIGNGLPQPVFDSGVVVTAAPMKDGPAVGLLQKGDVITAVNGNPLQISRSTSIPAAQKQVSDVISSIRQTPDGDAIEFQVQRGGSEADAGKATQTIAIKPTRVGGDAKSTAPQSIGVFLSPSMSRVERLKSNNPIEASKLAFQYLSDIYTQTLNGILSVLSTFLMGSGPPPGQSISGPIGLIKQGSNVVSTKDWTAVFLFTAALSVNLAVINALPLPALDGGQLVFVIAEAITGRKVDQRLQEGITSVAVLFLLWVSVSAAIGDVGNILSGVL